MKFAQRILHGARIGIWAGKDGWTLTQRRCSVCNRRLYIRGGDFACAVQLFWRYEQRSR